MDSYRIPTGNGASEYVEKRSRFLGLVQPVSSEDEAREIIAACKKQYHDARHNLSLIHISWNGCDKKRGMRRARLTAALSSTLSSSMPPR